MNDCDILVIGGGVAGLAAATAAAKGDAQVCLIEHEEKLGGILRQCVHRGFGPGLDGPSYITNLLKKLPQHIQIYTNTTVLALEQTRTALIARPQTMREKLHFKQVVLATGCYETPIGALSIAGTRPKGIYTAGEMQAMINIDCKYPKGPVVILGSGDLGLIMAAQLADAGFCVILVEQRSSCGGLRRNQSCLAKENVHLYCNSSIIEIIGEPKLEAVCLTNGTVIPCQTLLIACGLQEERTLCDTLGEKPSWLHLCGNCRQVQAMVETVVLDGQRAGHQAYEEWRKQL